MALILDGTSGASLVQPAVITQAALGPNVVGNGPAFSAYQSTAQSIPNNLFTKLQIQTKEFDTANAFDNVTNYRFTPLVAGYYQVNGGLALQNSAASLLVSLLKNGAENKRGVQFGTPVGTQSILSALVFLNGTTDYLELYGYQASGASSNAAAVAYGTYFQAAMIRSA